MIDYMPKKLTLTEYFDRLYYKISVVSWFLEQFVTANRIFIISA